MSKLNPYTVLLSGTARPSPALRARFGLTGRADVDVPRVLAADVAVDALARLMTEAIDKSTASDGRVDMRDVAAHVLATMAANQRKG